MTKTTLTLAASLATLALAAPAFALPAGAQARLNAESGLRIGASTTPGARAEAREQQKEARTEAREAKMGEREAAAKERAQKEIDRRIQALTQLKDRVQGMKRVSDDGKASVDATVAAQIATLTDLRARIDADDSTTTLKADMQSITKSYRIFALVIPQGHVKVSADKIHTAVDSMTALVAKLEARIGEATTSGADTTALAATLADAKTQLTSAATAADAAVALTASLAPDNGDKTAMDANKKALQDARAKIQAALKALDTARKDLRDIATGLKGLGLGASATGSASASADAPAPAAQ